MSDALNYSVLLIAAFGGGFLNAAAGGGTFLTLPALILVGVAPVSANATGTVALLPGYISSTFGFKEDLQSRKDVNLLLIIVASLVGGILGAALLLMTSNATFSVIIPWFMLLATLWFTFWPTVEKRMKRRSSIAGPMLTALGVFAVSVYGGYFNGGLGIILLALFGALGFADLNYMNGLKNAVSALLTIVAVAVYALGGTVVWEYAFLMMGAAIIGGYVGARWARRISRTFLRIGISAVGFIMTLIFFLMF